MTVPPSTAPQPCLINYNARLYDPQIARFLSADSIIPDPTNGQSFNRYAYVSNNPLNAVDPGGNDQAKQSIPATAEERIWCIEGQCFAGTPPIPDACGAGACPTGSPPSSGPLGGLYSMPGFNGFGEGGFNSAEGGSAGAGSAGATGGSNANASRSGVCARGSSAEIGAAGVAASTAEAAAEAETLAEFMVAFGPAAAVIAPLALSGDTEQQPTFVYHYTNALGHTAIDSSGIIIPSPSSGYVFVTPIIYSSGSAAQQALALNKTPTGYYQIPSSEIDPAGPPSPVPPANGQPGGGMEIKVPHAIPVSCAQWRAIGP